MDVTGIVIHVCGVQFSWGNWVGKLPKDKYHFGNAYYAAEVVSDV